MPRFAPSLFSALLVVLASVPAAGSPIQLSPPAPVGLGVNRIYSSPDSQWVHYAAQLDPDRCESLYRVHRSGGSSSRLSGPPTGICIVQVRDYSDDGQQLVFSIDDPLGPEVWSVRVDGTEDQAVRLDPGHPAGFDVLDVQAFEGSVLFEVWDGLVGGPSELHLVPLGGPASSGRRLDSQGASWWEAVPSADRVVYADGAELYSVGTAPGATPVRLDASIPGGQGATGGRVSGDGQFVLFLAEQAQAGRRDLFRVPIEGPAASAVQINGPLPTGHEIGNDPEHFQFDPTGSRVLFETFRSGQRGGLFAAPANGVPGSQVRLDTPPNDTAASATFTPDGQFVLFLGEQENEDRIDLYRVPTAGPADAAVRLSVTNEAVVTYWMTRDGDTVVYLADGGEWAGGDGPREYHRTSVEVAGVPIVLSGWAGQSVDVGFGWLEVAGHWVYRGQVDAGPFNQLFSVRLDGPPRGSQVLLDRDSDQGAVTSYHPLGDRWVSFVESRSLGGRIAVAAPVDGSSETFALHPLLPSWFHTDQARPMKDGQSVLYTLYAEETSPVGRTLYLHQIPEVFVDGFESGSLEGWSAIVVGD